MRPEQILHNRTIQGCQGEVTYRYIQKNGKIQRVKRKFLKKWPKQADGVSIIEVASSDENSAELPSPKRRCMQNDPSYLSLLEQREPDFHDVKVLMLPRNGLCYPEMAYATKKWLMLPRNGLCYQEMAYATKKWLMLPRNGLCYPEMAYATKKWLMLPRNGLCYYPEMAYATKKWLTQKCYPEMAYATQKWLMLPKLMLTRNGLCYPEMAYATQKWLMLPRNTKKWLMLCPEMAYATQKWLMLPRNLTRNGLC